MLPHAGMGSTDAQFNPLVKDLVNSLDKFKVPERKRRVARYSRADEAFDRRPVTGRVAKRSGRSRCRPEFSGVCSKIRHLAADLA
jgi:hypothetical protein